ncbi:MAG: response regulator [Pseudomonadota bacterium]
MSGTKHVILLVEDDKFDQELFRRGFADRPDCQIDCAVDGEEALSYLQSHPRPSLIVLDLNMPRMDGKELLRALKADRALRGIPAIVLSTSSEATDVNDCYDLLANAYAVKPNSPEELVRFTTRLEEFWLREACLPRDLSNDRHLPPKGFRAPTGIPLGPG